MPKAGKYDYPASDLDESIERVRKIHKTAQQERVKREIAAEILGLRGKSGWYNTIVGSLSMFGLVEAREGDIRITELAKTILYDNSSEAAKARAEAVRNVELFRDLFQQFRENPTDEQIRIFLKQKAYVDIAEVQSLTEKISRLFKSMAPYLSYTEQARLPTEAEPVNGRRENDIMETPKLYEEYKLGSGIEIKLPTDKLKEKWEIAKNAMDVILGINKEFKQD